MKKLYTLLRIEDPAEIPDTGKFINEKHDVQCDGKSGYVRTYEVSPTEAYERFLSDDASLLVWFKYIEVECCSEAGTPHTHDGSEVA